jgi:DNA-binding Xre family transcriptional regulator
MVESKSITVVIDNDVYRVISDEELSELRRRSQEIQRGEVQRERIAALLQTTALDLSEKVAELVSENARLKLAVARLEPHAEDALDAEEVERALPRLDARRDPLLSHKAVQRVLAGVSPLQVYREHRGLTLEALAEATGIALDTLQTLEGADREAEINARIALSDDQLDKLSEVLGVGDCFLFRENPWPDEPDNVDESGDIPFVAG